MFIRMSTAWPILVMINTVFDEVRQYPRYMIMQNSLSYPSIQFTFRNIRQHNSEFPVIRHGSHAESFSWSRVTQSYGELNANRRLTSILNSG